MGVEGCVLRIGGGGPGSNIGGLILDEKVTPPMFERGRTARDYMATASAGLCPVARIAVRYGNADERNDGQARRTRRRKQGHGSRRRAHGRRNPGRIIQCGTATLNARQWQPPPKIPPPSFPSP